MLAPKVAIPQTKAAESSTSRQAAQHATLVGHRHGQGSAHQPMFPRRAIGNQPTLQLARLASRAEKEVAREAPHGLSWDFGKIPAFPSEPANRVRTLSTASAQSGSTQPKLATGAVKGSPERETGAVADQVTRMSELFVAPARDQRSRKCAACEDEERRQFQTEPAPKPITVGHDFSRVRVHDDSGAGASTHVVDGFAHNVGRDIVFGRGHDAPDGGSDRYVLPPTVQHSGGAAPRVRRQDDAGAPGGAPASSPATPIMGTALASQLRSVSLTKASSPQVVRQAGAPGTIDVTQTDFLTFNAVAHFAPGAYLSGWTFGFFQLERPFEDYQVTLHEAGATGPDRDLNLYLNDSIRSQLPLLDHSAGSLFFQPTGLPATAKADPTTGEVKLTYKDWPTTPFTTSIEKPPGTFYTVSGVSARSFFFTAFGANDGSSTILLATFFWDTGGCDQVTPPDIATTKRIGTVNVAPVRLCSAGSCDAAEGAALFGSLPSKTATGVAAAEILGKFQDPGNYQGPATYQLPCAGPKRAAAGK